MDALLQNLKDGLTTGSLYALIALGYTMVYGILNFINFAHSDIVVLGGWVSLLLARAVERALAQAAGAPLPWWVGLVVLLGAMGACALVAFLIERLAYKPLRSAPRINVLITAIGVSLFLQNIGQQRWAFGDRPASVPELLPGKALFSVGGISVWLIDVAVLLTAVLLMVGLDWLVYHTKLGRGMRAVSHNPKTASLMGVPVDRVVSVTFVIGAALAAAGGFLWSIKYVQIKQTADMGWTLLGLKAFVAAVVGGIGNIRGAMLGGLAIGLLEYFAGSYISTRYIDVYVFGILIAVLLFRPSGILGKSTVEKV
jgi:branched-chain amino acid transport system permease protein